MIVGEKMLKWLTSLNYRRFFGCLLIVASFILTLSYASFRAELAVEGIASVDVTFKINISSVTSTFNIIMMQIPYIRQFKNLLPMVHYMK